MRVTPQSCRRGDPPRRPYGFSAAADAKLIRVKLTTNMRLLTLLALMGASAPVVAAQGPAEALSPSTTLTEPARVDDLLAPLLAAHRLPAVGGAVVRGGELIAIGVAGVRKQGDETPVTIDDLWHLGSCTKAMTATLAARLVERGLLRFDSTLGELFADEPNLVLAEGWGPVTIADLLRHRGRAQANLSKRDLWAELWQREGTEREQRTRLLHGVLGHAPEHPAGEYLYSNAGYAIVGAALERLDGRDFEALLTAEVFEPLGMQHAGFGPPGKKGAVDQPRAHRELRGSLIALEPGPMADNPPAIAPAGTVHASLADWARFAAVHLAGARGETDYLSADTFETLHESQGSYALGWVVGEREWAGGRVLTHAGSNTMWYAVAWIAPEKDLALLAVSNRAGDNASAGCDAAIGILREWASAVQQER